MMESTSCVIFSEAEKLEKGFDRCVSEDDSFQEKGKEKKCNKFFRSVCYSFCLLCSGLCTTCTCVRILHPTEYSISIYTV